MSEGVDKLAFQVEIKRVLEILSNDIYDSPYALLRENIQNAYDAILMRIAIDTSEGFIPKIEVTLKDGIVTISDNGIGMDREVVANNFWKAGSSGKNNEAAKKAGVVGTFGIGAMANFGVCTSLRVITHSIEGNETIETYAERESLSISEKCIEIKTSDETREPGTTVIAVLDNSNSMNEQGALNYLSSYIQYVKVPILINNKVASQKEYLSIFRLPETTILDTYKGKINQGNLIGDLIIEVNKTGYVSIKLDKIVFQNTPLMGDISLLQGRGSVMGLRNYFGLAQIPVSSIFNFGGIVNLSILHPTAGREALSRESISIVTQIINVIEQITATELSKLSSSDLNPNFLNYITRFNRFDLAGKIKVEVKPFNEMIALEEITTKIHDRDTYFYGGRDPQTILAFANENSSLIHLSQSNPRRNIQNKLIKQKGITEVPDSPRRLKVFNRTELSLPEASLILRITNVLSDDYLIPDNKVFIAEISHQVPSMVEINGSTLEVYLSRESGAVQQVLKAYETAHEIYNGFVKDFVRNHLYQKFAQYVPSSTRQGAEALHKILMKNKELYKYEYSDLGDVESLISEWVSEKIEFSELLKQSSSIIRTHSQSVRLNQIGNVEQEVPSITAASSAEEKPKLDIYGALPSLDRSDDITNMKILKTAESYDHLNNFKMFIGISDRVFKKHLDFFLEPHTTKVIWGMHRIVYIFTHASNRISLYYDIELKQKLSAESTGGIAVPTTTIRTKNRIFVPVIHELIDFFDITEGTKEFYVRHDLITDFSS
ncbi:ATP-binding protein [Changchengzhania lutea]|uniref:ATP-binding protein n=1 Tax=Changchengzhania lutea TaxID=2049305 RepID=UPI00115E9FB9|nr:ATP-binding protein [Changchengzhania lutea]